MDLRSRIASILKDYGYETDRPYGEVVSAILALIIQEVPKEKEPEIDDIVSQIRGHGSDGSWEYGWNAYRTELLSKLGGINED